MVDFLIMIQLLDNERLKNTNADANVYYIACTNTCRLTFETVWDSYNAAMKHPEEISELNGKQ